MKCASRTYGFFLCLVVCAGSDPAAASNLVINGSFEAFSACPANFGEIDRATGWSSPTLGSPDYFNSCASSGSGLSTPANAWGSQVPASGNAYASARVWASVPPNTANDYREYIQGTLSQSLVAGQSYTVSFLVSLGDSHTPIVEIGAYLSPSPISLSIGTVLNVTPQVVHSGSFLNNTTGWTMVSGSFVASGGESYIVIGNFLDDATTTATSHTATRFAFYYIDDVSVDGAVPEPGAGAMVGAGIAILSGIRSARRKAQNLLRH